MSALYWITVLGNLNGIGFFLTIVGCACIFISLLIKDVFDSWRKMFVTSCSLVGLGLLILTFIPTTRELYVIYGVGGTTDYLKENSTAKQLPDKYIKVLNKWADEQLNSLNNNESKD